MKNPQVPEKSPIYMQGNIGLTNGDLGVEVRLLGAKGGLTGSYSKRSFYLLGGSIDMLTGEVVDMTHYGYGNREADKELVISGGDVFGGSFALDAENNFKLKSTTTNLGIFSHIE